MRRPRRVEPSVFRSAAAVSGFDIDTSQACAVDALTQSDRSVYIWGPAGRGKTWIMNTFVAAIEPSRCVRMHFHEFFRDLHAAARAHRYDLAAALDNVLGKADVVCFDEFHVHDPADGIYIARLLDALRTRGVRVVLTSNYAPRDLMPNPLFHDGFVPTIDSIEQHFDVVSVDGGVDHRAGTIRVDGFAAGMWVSPADVHRVPTVGFAAGPRGIRARVGSSGDLWVDFADLCGAPTSASDYLALASDFDHWTLDAIPPLMDREPTQRFVNLVDVLYDRDVTCTFVGDAPLSAVRERLSASVDGARTASRLSELTDAQRTSASNRSNRTDIHGRHCPPS